MSNQAESRSKPVSAESGHSNGKPIKHLTKLLSHEHVVGQLTHYIDLQPILAPLQTVLPSPPTPTTFIGRSTEGIIAMTFVKPISDRTRKSA